MVSSLAVEEREIGSKIGFVMRTMANESVEFRRDVYLSYAPDLS
jgi:hypothetical protein